MLHSPRIGTRLFGLILIDPKSEVVAPDQKKRPKICLVLRLANAVETQGRSLGQTSSLAKESAKTRQNPMMPTA